MRAQHTKWWLVLGLALALAPQPGPARAQSTCIEPRELIIGFNGHAFHIQATRDGNYLKRFIDEYKEIGGRSIRLGIDWASIQIDKPKREDDGLDFTGDRYGIPWDYTEIVTHFHDAGIEVQGLFSTAPKWVLQPWEDWMRCSDLPECGKRRESLLYASEENLRALTDTAHKTLVYFYYNGGITRWEFWNEPYIPASTCNCPLTPYIGRAEEYGKWFGAFLEGVRQAEVELGADFEIAIGGINGNTIDEWTINVLVQPDVTTPFELRQINALAFHPYDEQGVEREGLNPIMLEKGLEVARDYGLKVWITEFGYNDPNGKIQENKLCYALSRLSSECRITRVNLHMLHDIDKDEGCTKSEEHEDPNCYGLINNNFISPEYRPAEDRKQTAWLQFQQLSQLLDGALQLPADGSACAPATPQPISPQGEIDLSLNRPEVEFSWGTVTDPLGTAVTYQVDLYKCNDSDCNQPVRYTPEMKEPSFSYPVECGHHYRWNLEARSGYGVPSRPIDVYFNTSCNAQGGSGLLDTALIIDSSGSMSSNDPVGQRRHAARIFFDVSPADDNVGIVDFDSVVQEGTTSDTLLRLGDEGVIGSLSSLVYGIDSSGGTDIGKGLVRSCQLLTNFSNGHEKRAGILLTDGQGPWQPADRACYGQEGWSLWAIGFGSANLAQLRSIVGSPDRAIVVSSAEKALCELQQFRARITGDNTIPCAQHVVAPGARVLLTAAVPPGRTRMSFYTAWPGSDVVMTLTSPTGRVIGRSTTASDVRHLTGPTFEVYTLQRPEAGTWTIELFGANVRPGGEPVTFGGTVLTGTEVNLPPDVSAAAPSVARIWPPNHKMVSLEILGVTDPEGNPVTITVTGVTQDEPVSSPDPKHAPDAIGVTTATAVLRAERDGGGNGRIYEIHFQATDDKGASAEGSVKVCVPHDQGAGACVDDGQRFDATVR